MLPEGRRDQRGDQVGDERGHERAEGHAEDEGDRELDEVPAQEERAKLFANERIVAPFPRGLM